MGVLDGKVAIVTGAGGGLGREHALHLATEGASVVVNDVSPAVDGVVDEITSAGGRAVANQASVSDWKAAEGLIAQAIDAFGDLHILVNNAGVVRDAMSFNMSEDQWDLVTDVHLKGHFCPSRHAGAWWRQQSKAGAVTPRRIINTTSEAGLFGSAGQANYTAAKAGIVGLTWGLAREYERYGVTVNAIAPRARTPMTEAMPMFARPETGFDQYDPANISPVVAWLASDAAGDVNGQVFIVVGARVQVVAAFHPVGWVERDGRWTAAALAAAKQELFGDRSSGIPPFGG
ncbi:MAG: hypothetical protein QOG64_2575 [Acidimicrobiaceae bacterium]|nr:hypothetical protein [Acidimicrobiaceae bacterium]